MGKGDVLPAPELHQQLGIVAARIHLFQTEHGCRIGNAPGVHVKHRRDGHVDVIGAQQPSAVDTAHDGRHAHGVQHQLAVGEIHPFGVASGAGGVERGGDRVFVEILEHVFGAGRRQQGLVLAHEVGQLGSLVWQIRQQQGLLDRAQVSGHRLIESRKLTIHQHQTVVGVVDGVGDLLGRKSHIDGVDDRANHRDGEHAFQVAVAVPVHNRHGIASLHARRCQYVGEAAYAFVEGRVGVADRITVDDFARLFITTARQQQALDQQRALIRAIGGRKNASL